MTSEKFCLRWNDFESNISVAFRELRDDKDFFDVTLACDDEQIQAHKVILSACSPFFRNVLRRNPHQHPLLYLKGVKFTDLQSVLNFMYHGEVNVAQEELNSFLAVAEDLRVKGLTQNNQQPGSANRVKENFNSPRSPPAPKSRPPEREPLPPPKRPRTNLPTPAFGAQDDDDIQEVLPVKTEPRDPAPPVPQQQAYLAPPPATLPPAPSEQEGQLQQMDDSMQQYQGDESYDDFGQYGAEGGYEDQGMGQADGGKGRMTDPSQMDQFIGRQDRNHVCLLCNMFSHHSKHSVRNHVESKHFPNTFSYPCGQCEVVCSTRKAYENHIQKHKQTLSLQFQ